MRKKIKTNGKRLRQTIAICTLLLYPFNNTIINLVLFGKITPYILITIGILLLLPDLKKTFSKKLALFIMIEMVVVAFFLIDQKLDGRYGYMIIQLLYLAMVPVLINIDVDKKAVLTSVTIFSVEHILGTLFPIVLPDLYEKSFLSFVCSAYPDYCPARHAFVTGMNAGLTGQSSTNGCYMAIIALFHTCNYLSDKKKQSAILSIASIMCLLIIGKRAHLLFSILAILIVYITRSDNFNLIRFLKTNIKIIAIGIVAFLGIFVISSSIPQINTTIDRIVASKDSEDVTTGRGPLYELAIEKWEEHPVLGNGWGAYTQFSHETFGTAKYKSDYIHAHNDYLELLCDRGMIGLIVYLMIIFWVIKNAYKMRNKGSFEKFALAYMIFFILYGFTGAPLQTISNFVFLLIVIVIIMKGKINEKNRRNDVQQID